MAAEFDSNYPRPEKLEASKFQRSKCEVLFRTEAYLPRKVSSESGKIYTCGGLLPCQLGVSVLLDRQSVDCFVACPDIRPGFGNA